MRLSHLWHRRLKARPAPVPMYEISVTKSAPPFFVLAERIRLLASARLSLPLFALDSGKSILKHRSGLGNFNKPAAIGSAARARRAAANYVIIIGRRPASSPRCDLLADKRR